MDDSPRTLKFLVTFCIATKTLDDQNEPWKTDSIEADDGVDEDIDEFGGGMTGGAWHFHAVP